MSDTPAGFSSLDDAIAALREGRLVIVVDAEERENEGDFICAAERLMKPGSSALFVVDRVGDTDALLPGIRGLGGTVLKTSVDLTRAKLIQSTLLAIFVKLCASFVDLSQPRP